MIENTDIQNAYLSPASFAQQRLWFLDQLLPNSPLYNIADAIRIMNTLDIPALEQTFHEIVRRHDSLRTTFASIDGVPMQVVTDTLTPPLSFIDLSTIISLEERWEQAQKLVEEEAGRPFDLAHGPLIRATLVCVEQKDHLLLLTMHHSISDGWSRSVFMHEFASLYTAFAQGQPSPLPELPIQYADFAEWQRSWLQGEVREKLLTYWKHQLNGLQPLELPTDRPRPAFFNSHGSCLAFELPVSLTQSLKALSRQEEVTLFMLLLAAFQIVLARYSGQDDIVVGSPIANRTRTELEGLIGFFANTLVLRTDLSGDLSFHALLSRVRAMLLDAYAHQDLPFEQLVEELQVPRDPSRNPLFQVMFVLQNTPSNIVELPGLTLEIRESYIGAAAFDLVLFITENNDTLEGVLEYSTDLFDEETIRRLQGHYQHILEQVVDAPEQPLATLSLLTPAERQQLLYKWNDTATPFPPARCIHLLIEEQVQRTPHTVAIQGLDRSLSYQELNTCANHLAHHLHRLGVQPGGCVGLYLHRSTDAFIALLAILKAGCAYVPIDPANPSERVAFMLQNAQISTLLTHQQLLTSLPRATGAGSLSG